MSPEPHAPLPDDAITIADNRDASRYELRVGGELAAYVTYRVSSDRIAFIHTETLDTFEGHGIGGRLVRFALDAASTRGLRVIPRCPFVKRYIAVHPEYQDLVG